MEPKLILHGGIESTDRGIIPEKEQALEHACRETYGHLKSYNAIDSVEFAIRIMEDNPLFNAGTGAMPEKDGVQRLHAFIMDGSNSKAGGVAGVRYVRHPITVARYVMEKSPHHLIVGEEAQKFAYLNGIEAYPTMTIETFERWQRIKEEAQKTHTEHPQEHYGTVGAVAIDKDGKIAAGTSTGGWATSLPGRVGDVPIIGHGTYADKNVGVSCTGNGEKISNRCLSVRIGIYMEEGYSLKKAAEKSLQKLKEIGGIGGFIAIDSNGDAISVATQGAYMPVSRMPK